jgi:hypothetical protein
MWKYVFLGDIKLCVSNNRSKLSVALIFVSLDSHEENFFA